MKDSQLRPVPRFENKYNFFRTFNKETRTKFEVKKIEIRGRRNLLEDNRWEVQAKLSMTNCGLLYCMDCTARLSKRVWSLGLVELSAVRGASSSTVELPGKSGASSRASTGRL